VVAILVESSDALCVFAKQSVKVLFVSVCVLVKITELSRVSKFAFNFVPQVPFELPLSGLVKLKFVVLASAIFKLQLYN